MSSRRRAGPGRQFGVRVGPGLYELPVIPTVEGVWDAFGASAVLWWDGTGVSGATWADRTGSKTATATGSSLVANGLIGTQPAVIIDAAGAASLSTASNAAAPPQPFRIFALLNWDDRPAASNCTLMLWANQFSVMRARARLKTSTASLFTVSDTTQRTGAQWNTGGNFALRWECDGTNASHKVYLNGTEYTTAPGVTSTTLSETGSVITLAACDGVGMLANVALLAVFPYASLTDDEALLIHDSLRFMGGV
jgi:hypothetical protein